MSFLARYRRNSARCYLVSDSSGPVAGNPDLHCAIQIRERPKRSAHLLRAGNSLKNFPHRGRPVVGTEMRELVANYPYIIRYRVGRDGNVRILRVRHTSRRPTTP